MSTIPWTHEDYAIKYAKLEALLDEALRALGKIGSVNQMRPELGQIIESEHYEAAWLDCVGIAQETFTKIQEARRSNA